MKACVLKAPEPVENNPLVLLDTPTPQPGDRQLLVWVIACGICRTDLHVVEGELPPKRPQIIPGHQVVGRVEKTGSGSKYAVGARVGIPWLHSTDQTCFYCRSGRENLC